MYLTYIILAFTFGIVIGIAIAQFSKELKHIVTKLYKAWTFKHKAIHPFKPQEKE
ncbi:MAG: hypothetical protein VX100_01080 [Pseudomonadota bacterium]|uniref:hypothetical protein n=1 Tax=Pseudoalteromonas spongiae TaxID=298657 RepID=UPI0012FE6E10|nr:hypothetical protein [Pseudoalteromonas spongiae]MEC8324703.1 hypothetical protein [Pseudomonadota bacterium]